MNLERLFFDLYKAPAEADVEKNYSLKNPPHPGGFVKTEIIEPLSFPLRKPQGRWASRGPHSRHF